jgi:hypothetical protein
MSEDNLGAGIALDQNFDFSTGPTGDLSATSGKEELQKDLSVLMAQNLQEYLGQPPTTETKVDIKSDAIDIALADSRVIGVNRDAVSVEIVDREEISLSLPVVTNTEQQYTFVFNI